MPNTVWSDRVEAILSDDRTRKLAGLLYYLVEHHLEHTCFHKRACAESMLMTEAIQALGYLKSEQEALKGFLSNPTAQRVDR